MIGNLEYLFPLVSEISFKGVFFFDVGNTWAQGMWPWDGQAAPVRLRGRGAVVLPHGAAPVRVGLEPQRPGPGQPKRVMEFTIGTAF